ncbi:hypothetical protein JCM10296v2_002123 [Rhodotorula toruloides]
MRSSLVTSSAGKKSDAAVAQKASQAPTERKKRRDDQREKGQAEEVSLPSKGTPLTPHLVASGFTTVDSLASLALLDSAILNNVLDLVRTNAVSAKMQSTTAPAPPSVIQLQLLAKSFNEAGRA